MKYLFIMMNVLMFIQLTHANTPSLVFPLVSKAISCLEKKQSSEDPLVQRVINRLIETKISDRRWKRLVNLTQSKGLSYYFLPPDDEIDRLIAKESQKSVFGRSYEDFLDTFTSETRTATTTGTAILPKIAIQAYKVLILDPEDEVSKDDLYLYFFVTDGVIPTGRITSIYRGNGSGDTIVLNNLDRAVYPIGGDISEGRIPHNHLIIDYGIIENDSDDIRELQRISEAIIGITLDAYYTTGNMKLPQMLRLRKEIRSLSSALLSLNHDDRLVNESLYFRPQDFITMFPGSSTLHEFNKDHQGKRYFSTWKYRISFRLLKF